MARSVLDVLLLARVLSGVHPRDHATVPGTLPEVPARVEPDLTGVRVGLIPRIGRFPLDGQVRDRTVAFARRLAELGAQVHEVELAWDPDVVMDLELAHFGHFMAAQVRRLTTGQDHLLSPYLRQFILATFTAAAARSFLDCTVLEASMQGDLARVMADLDVLVCPTNGVTELAADGDYCGPQTFQGTPVRHYWAAHHTVPFNICNRCPVLAVPTGLADNGIPTSAQIVGHPYDESMVFRVGLAAEAAGFGMPDWPDLLTAPQATADPGSTT